MATRRNHNIQTPGQTPQAPADAEQEQDTRPVDPMAAGSELPDIDETPEPNEAAAPAPTQAPNPAEPAPMPVRASAPRLYRDMRADEIDVSKLTAPVLCKEGWLVPPTIGPARTPVGA